MSDARQAALVWAMVVLKRNARHGLTAETVIEGLEDSKEYRAFEAIIISDYDAQTAVEREHNRGDEAEWWKSVNLDPVIVARQLWEHTRLNEAPVHRRIGMALPGATAGASMVRDPEAASGARPVDGAGSDPHEPLVGPPD